MIRRVIEALQPVGRALMLPIAVLPVAGLLLRLGQPDLLDWPLLAAAGDALFAHLGLLFAVGVATGIARDGNGASALAGVVCYLVATQGARIFLAVPPEVTAGLADGVAASVSAEWRGRALARLDVPIGIAAGLIGGVLYNRYAAIRLPDYLAFFGGRRFVPIVAGAAGLFIALAVGLSYGAIDAALDIAGRGLAASGAVGLFLFGLLNRLLLVTGLHHLLNNVPWFVLGEYQGANGDLRRFFAGDPAAGAFMSGFFPVMMFGLPAACLAMYRAADPGRRRAVGGLLASLAATSFLTGVTEPIEFSFLFLAPVLFAIHAVLTGIAMVVMDALGVRMGFGFSAGLFDYLLNFGQSTRPLLLLPVGAAYFALYYLLFSLAIRRFDLPTPGREGNGAAAGDKPVPDDAARGGAFAAALGGAANVVSIDACMTRLRLIVRDQARVDEPALKALGAMGVVRPSPRAVQVVVGPAADAIADAVRLALGTRSPSEPKPTDQPATTAIRPSAALMAALGGDGAVADAQITAGRLRLVLTRDPAPDALDALPGLRAWTQPAPRILHLLGEGLTE